MSQSNNTKCTTDPIVARIISSSIGSLLTALAVTPLDVVKVRQQAVSAEPFNKEALAQCTRCGAFVMNNGLIHGELVVLKSLSPHFSKIVCNLQHSVGSVGSAAAAAMTSSTTVPSSHSQQFPSSIPRGIAQIYRTEGLSGIYAGLAPTLVMSIPATVLYFTAYDELKLIFTRHHLVGESIAPAIAGMSARILASAATSPFELVRTLMQSRDGLYINGSNVEGVEKRIRAGTIASMRALVQSGGILSLWRGLEPTLWRDVPFSAIYWFTLEDIRRRIDKSYPSRSPLSASLRDFAAGATGGMLAAIATTPFDVVKTRRQVFSALSGEASDAIRDQSAAAGNGSTPRVLREILREEGVQGAFRGLTARVLKIAPACAIMIASYESGKRYLTPHLIK